MRSMKYLPSVSALNSIKYLRQLYQKLNSIEVNVVINKITTNNDIHNRSETTRAAVKQAIDEKTSELCLKSNQLPENKSQLFETALNEWIECNTESNTQSNIGSNSQLLMKESTSVDVLTVEPKPKPSAITSGITVSVPSGVSRSGVELRTKQLLQSMSRLDSTINTKLRLQEFNKLLVTYPESISYAVHQNAIQRVLRLNKWSDNALIRQHSSQVLALLGYSPSPKGAGIRILSIDGGGTRGVLIIEILRELERLSGKRIHEMFDLICGVSTGAIIAMLLGSLQTPINQCEEYYHKFSSHLFKSDFFRGTGRLLWSHAYYDTTVWEKILKEVYSETLLIETKQSAESPHVLAVSAIMNKPSIQAYLFRNYELPIHSRALSQYEGSSNHKIWEAVRASAAAPGYLQEFRLGKDIHLDGGILINNPTAVAIHEAKLLWPNEPIQCVVSLGSGRYIPNKNTKTDESTVNTTSLKTKLIRLIDSATDTEMVHTLIKDLLSQNTYYRINPFLTEMGTIDESRPEKLGQMKADARMYVHKNEHKVTQAVKQLTQKRKLSQRFDDWLRIQYKLRV